MISRMNLNVVRMTLLSAALGTALLLTQKPALANYSLNARYSGVVSDIEDTYGVFGNISLGDAVNGVLRYSSNLAPYYADDTFAAYDLSVTPDGKTAMTGKVGSIALSAKETLTAQSYNFGAPDNLFGHDFQFGSNDVSSFNTTSLPTGYQLRGGGVYVGLFANDRDKIPFSALPTSLLSIDEYDSLYTGGFFFVSVFNADRKYVGDAFVGFQLAGVENVPEPGTVALLAGLGVCGGGLLLRRRKGCA